MSYYMIRVSIMLFVTNQSNFRDLNCTLEMWKEVTEDASGKFECDYLGKTCFSHYVKFACMHHYHQQLYGKSRIGH